MPYKLPLVDFAKWRFGDTAERQKIVQEVDNHLQQVGFLMLVNHGIPEQVRTSARQSVADFFALPEESKALYRCPEDAYRGWVGQGLESNASSYGSASGTDNPGYDLKEAYSIGPQFEGVEALKTASPRWYADDIWPDQHIPDFQSSLSNWWQAANTLSNEIMSLLAEALDISPDWVADNFNAPMATITANLYPQVSQSDKGWRVGEHTDFGTITLLDRDADNGLQVEIEPGKWVEAPVVKNALTVNLGSMMVLYSDNRWRANPHRVKATPGAKDNLSLVFFHSPNHNAPLPVNSIPLTANSIDDKQIQAAGDFLGWKMDQILLADS